VSEIDWKALQKEATDAVLPDGDYNVMVTEAECTKTSNGKPMYKVKMRVIDGPKKDRPIWSNFTLSAESPVALRIFFQQMAQLGLTADYFAANPHPDQVARDLVNRMATVTLGATEWQGAMRNQVTAVKAYSGTGPPPPGATVGPPVVSAPGGAPAAGPPIPSTPPTVAAAATPGIPPAPPAQPF
jgi:hypothetical protein